MHKAQNARYNTKRQVAYPAECKYLLCLVNLRESAEYNVHNVNAYHETGPRGRRSAFPLDASLKYSTFVENRGT